MWHRKNKTLFRITGSWKFHYLSWKSGVPKMPRLIIKYEDLIDNINIEFRNIINFLSSILNFNIDEAQIKFSIENSDFKILSDYEKKLGFDEAKNNIPFFRKGEVNQWKEKLSLTQIRKIENNLNNEMKTLGYL